MSPAGTSRTDLSGGALWVALGLAMVMGAWRMDRFESMGATVYTAPGLVPGVYGLLLLGLGLLLGWRGLRAGRAGAGTGTPTGTPTGTFTGTLTGTPASTGADPLLNRRIVVTLVLTLAYAVATLGRLPFGPSTAVFVAAFCWWFDGRPPSWPRLRTALLTGVGCAVGVVLVFERIFLVRLP